MDETEIRKNAFAMPFSNPGYPRGPYHFRNREYFIITYETDIERLRDIVPAPLEVVEPLVNFEIIRMPDSTGFGDYTESGQVIPVRYQGKAGGYSHAMYLDDQPPISGGREIWGFPKKLAKPTLKIESESLIGLLDYGSYRVATATMGFKHLELDKQAVLKALSAPAYLLKIIPHVDGTVRICELVEYQLENLVVKGAWTGPACLELANHALAPLADLPVRRVVKAMHALTDLTLPYGQVVHDYLKK